jgi:carbon monoxide dehydrogenase subunit G
MINGTVEINRPVEAVWKYIAEPKNNKEWESGVEEMVVTSEGPIGLGSMGRRVETYMGRDEFVWEITEWKPNKSGAMKYESDKFAGDGAYSVDATDGGTRVTYRFDGSPKNVSNQQKWDSVEAERSGV